MFFGTVEQGCSSPTVLDLLVGAHRRPVHRIGGASRSPRSPGCEDKGGDILTVTLCHPKILVGPAGLLPLSYHSLHPRALGPPHHLRIDVWAGEGTLDTGRHRLRAESGLELTLRTSDSYWSLVPFQPKSWNAGVTSSHDWGQVDREVM